MRRILDESCPNTPVIQVLKLALSRDYDRTRDHYGWFIAFDPYVRYLFLHETNIR